MAFCSLAIYLAFCAVSFYEFVEPSLNGTNGWRVYADSDVYMGAADFMRGQGTSEAAVALLSLARNLILPAIVALTLKSAAHFAIFNIALFFLAMGILARTFSRFNWYIFLPIILASPTTYQALLTLNKEIFVFLSAALIARWFKTRSNLLLGILVVLSLALRWEQALVILCFVFLLKTKVSPRHAALLLLVGISIAYPFALAFVSNDIPEEVRGVSSSEFYRQINQLQNYGLYFVLVIPKIVTALLSQVVRFWTPFVDTARLHDLPTGPFVLVDQLCMCFVVIAAWVRRLWVIDNPVVYFVLVYCLIFFAAPENSPRYLYLLFVLMAAVLSSTELQSLRVERIIESPSNHRFKLLLSRRIFGSRRIGAL